MFCPITYKFATSTEWASGNNQMQLPNWMLLPAFKKPSVKCSGAIAEGQNVQIQKYLKVKMLKMHPYKVSLDPLK